ERHRFGHDQHKPIALDGGNHRKTDTGIAAGRLDDRPAGSQSAGLLRVLDHRQRDAVLDRAGRIRALALHPYLVVGKQPREADVRGIADGGEDVFGLHVAGSLVSLTESRWRKRESNVLAW